MRQAAERALNDSVKGKAWKTFFLGNSPCAHWEAASARTFVHKAQLIKGDVELQPGSEFSDYAWLTREEIIEVVDDAVLHDLFQKLLPKI